VRCAVRLGLFVLACIECAGRSESTASVGIFRRLCMAVERMRTSPWKNVAEVDKRRLACVSLCSSPKRLRLPQLPDTGPAFQELTT
jgi:hypothetical protein